MDFVIFLGGLLLVGYLADKIYKNINLDNYSPKWEYFCKAFLYGVIMVFTLMYGKGDLGEVSPLEWTIVAVSGIEGAGNYINYIKEKRREKELIK